MVLSFGSRCLVFISSGRHTSFGIKFIYLRLAYINVINHQHKAAPVIACTDVANGKTDGLSCITAEVIGLTMPSAVVDTLVVACRDERKIIDVGVVGFCCNVNLKFLGVLVCSLCKELQYILIAGCDDR